MKTTQVLDILKTKLEEIDPPIGKIHTSLLSSPKPEQVITDLKFKDLALGDVLKAFIIRPGNAIIRRGTTGRQGFSMRLRNIEIQGLISINIDNVGAAERVLEDAWEEVIQKLQNESRIEDETRGDTFS